MLPDFDLEPFDFRLARSDERAFGERISKASRTILDALLPDAESATEPLEASAA